MDMKRTIIFLTFIIGAFLLYADDSYEQAIKYYTRSALKWNAEAQFRLALLLEKDDDAFFWCKEAADQGHIDATYLLGGFYLEGRGVEKDSDKAVSLYRQAADKGYEKAKERLKELGVQ